MGVGDSSFIRADFQPDNQGDDVHKPLTYADLSGTDDRPKLILAQNTVFQPRPPHWNNADEVKKRELEGQSTADPYPTVAPIFQPDSTPAVTVLAPGQRRDQAPPMINGIPVPGQPQATEVAGAPPQEENDSFFSAWRVPEVAVQIGAGIGWSKILLSRSSGSTLTLDSETTTRIGPFLSRFQDTSGFGGEAPLILNQRGGYQGALKTHFKPIVSHLEQLAKDKSFGEDWTTKLAKVAVLEPTDTEVGRLSPGIDAQLSTLSAGDRQAVLQYQAYQKEMDGLEKYSESVRKGITKFDQLPPSPKLKAFFDPVHPDYAALKADTRFHTNGNVLRGMGQDNANRFEEATNALTKELKEARQAMEKSHGGMSTSSMLWMGYAALMDDLVEDGKPSLRESHPGVRTWIADTAQMGLAAMPWGGGKFRFLAKGVMLPFIHYVGRSLDAKAQGNE